LATNTRLADKTKSHKNLIWGFSWTFQYIVLGFTLKKNIEYICTKETFTSFKSAEIAKKLQNKEENPTNNQTKFKRSFVDFLTPTNLYRVPQMP